MSVIWLAIKSFLGGLSLTTYLLAGAVVAFGVWTYVVYDAGYDKADALWVGKALEAKIAKLEHEAWVTASAAADEVDKQAKLDAEDEEQEKKTNEYIKQLESRPDKCLLGPDAGSLQ